MPQYSTGIACAGKREYGKSEREKNGDDFHDDVPLGQKMWQDSLGLT